MVFLNHLPLAIGIIDQNDWNWNFLGLDPAGPGFEDADEELKLNKNSAKYVQCIHTDSWFGTETEYGEGHGNFIMNDGEYQPGCSYNPICDHSRVYEYFQESMSKNHKFEGVECRVKNKKNRKDRIGIYSERKNGTFCVETESEFPYAMSHWALPINGFVFATFDVICWINLIFVDRSKW